MSRELAYNIPIFASFVLAGLVIIAVVGPPTFATDGLVYLEPLAVSLEQGNVFAGATLPFGMVKAVADMDGANDNCITGFSAFHGAGVGPPMSMANFPLFPFDGCIAGDIEKCDFSKHHRRVNYYPDTIQAIPGYFSVTLASGIRVDMTATAHAALFCFMFPTVSDHGGPNHLVIQLDLSDLSGSCQGNSMISVSNQNLPRLTGLGEFISRLGARKYTVYFCADFRPPDLVRIRGFGTYFGSVTTPRARNLTILQDSNGAAPPGGGWVHFESPRHEPISVRMGLSFLSQAKACEDAETEIPEFNFDVAHGAAMDTWTMKLDTIYVDDKGVDGSLLRIFWLGIYSAFVNPQKYSEVTTLAVASPDPKPYFDSFCLSVSYSTHLSLLTILDPEETAGIIQSVLDMYSEEGWLPDCHMSLSLGCTHSGYGADIVLVDGFLKEPRNGIDFKTGYAAIDSEHNILLGSSRGISKTLAYSYRDFIIAQFARERGHLEDYERYLQRSTYWINLFEPNQTSTTHLSTTGFLGFFQPRYRNGTWCYTDPDRLWKYSFYVPHDQAALIALLGGPKQFVRRLGYAHDSKLMTMDSAASFLSVFQYHYAGRPALSSKRAHHYIPRAFSLEPSELPWGGSTTAIGSFVVLTMIGLFPNAGQDVYLIIPPFFREVAITNPITRNVSAVRNINFDPTYKNIYIQKATLKALKGPFPCVLNISANAVLDSGSHRFLSSSVHPTFIASKNFHLNMSTSSSKSFVGQSVSTKYSFISPVNPASFNASTILPFSNHGLIPSCHNGKSGRIAR
ncbi:hypothetical protein P152DRAFT_468366 [Eremomyces bilateralis CBS 781.70]|uniref:Glycoside hydrolase family 92 protein n=1 Tax=Eremomyces bilateralis CBS 781.70 TaxID=1392243 RepID=A0A6G1FUS7_9PEZI|nr:uncharacterized protein P152DRAFT_468366 [Eremomyces bilateralis CBS 781.70]KAF1809534.1 hypothetical protein P152DRAFT_468366 [Eremomyces bilateralis CBS 781.70]